MPKETRYRCHFDLIIKKEVWSKNINTIFGSIYLKVEYKPFFFDNVIDDHSKYSFWVFTLTDDT